MKKALYFIKDFVNNIRFRFASDEIREKMLYDVSVQVLKDQGWEYRHRDKMWVKHYE